MNIELQKEYLQTTPILEVDDVSTQQLIKEIDRSTSLKEQAIALYYLVRDRFLYDSYHLDLRPEALKSSTILEKRRAWCVEKSIVLATSLRALGISSSLGYGIVINHIGVDRLTRCLKRKEIVFHGYVSGYLDGKWVKTTPAFDINVCRLSGVEPLDWDGENDALFQAYQGDQKFMEFIHFYGDFDDVPVQLMNDEMERYYPHLFEEVHAGRNFSFNHLKSD
jgi:transglutaminase-like putative cysteine protease